MNKYKKYGFTIIEVVLVLAIAGLIFLMVFIALPALQRNQRDTQRKNDLSRVMAAIRNYQSNNRGNLPDHTYISGLADEPSGFTATYLSVGGDSFRDPDGIHYGFWGRVPGDDLSERRSPVSGGSIIYFVRGAKCGGDNVVPREGSNMMALGINLEGGGFYCLDN
jgi:prepilin-type N-terminal cleavage/methylation domain-containing protein